MGQSFLTVDGDRGTTPPNLPKAKISFEELGDDEGEPHKETPHPLAGMAKGGSQETVSSPEDKEALNKRELEEKRKQAKQLAEAAVEAQKLVEQKRQERICQKTLAREEEEQQRRLEVAHRQEVEEEQEAQ